MATMLDYLAWRGDLSFRKSPFNTNDSLLLTRFSYLPFDDISFEEPLTIADLYQQFIIKNKQHDHHLIMQEDFTLLKELAASKRFGHLLVQHYINKIDVKNEQQFSALIIQLDSRTTYVVYRGTDLTLVGWKEDFNMSFKKVIPSQQTSINYLENIKDDIRERLYIGVNSKGGNLAIFAAAFCSSELQNKIVKIYNFDGPGFNEAVLKSEGYAKIQKKIHTFVPETAIVGMFLNHNSSYKVVKSQGDGLVQHDTYSWLCKATDLVYTEQRDGTSKRLENNFTQLLNSLNMDERKALGDTFYQIILTTKATTLKELSENWSKNLWPMLKAYSELDKKTSDLVKQTLPVLIKNIAGEWLNNSFANFTKE